MIGPSPRAVRQAELGLRSALLRTQDALRLAQNPQSIGSSAFQAAISDIRNGIMAAYGANWTDTAAAPYLQALERVEAEARALPMNGLGQVPGMIPLAPGASFRPAPISPYAGGPQGPRMAIGPQAVTLPALTPTPEAAWRAPIAQGVVVVLRQVESWLRRVTTPGGLGDCLACGLSGDADREEHRGLMIGVAAFALLAVVIYAAGASGYNR